MHYEIGKSLKIINFDFPQKHLKTGSHFMIFPVFSSGRRGEKNNFHCWVHHWWHASSWRTKSSQGANLWGWMKTPIPTVGASLWEIPFYKPPKKKHKLSPDIWNPESLIFSQNQVALRLEKSVQKKGQTHFSRQNSHSHIHFHGFQKSFQKNLAKWMFKAKWTAWIPAGFWKHLESHAFLFGGFYHPGFPGHIGEARPRFLEKKQGFPRATKNGKKHHHLHINCNCMVFSYRKYHSHISICRCMYIYIFIYTYHLYIHIIYKSYIIYT